MEGLKKAKITICGGEFAGKIPVISKILSEELNLNLNQMEFVRGAFRELIVEVILNGQSHTVISRQGPGFFTNDTPTEISNALQPFF